ncbi:MAG: hypothetical protein AAGJ40_13760 [Planctomycetota bacterium]
MIHYTCDRCRCQINPEHQQRFVVHIEVHGVSETPIVDDESIDHLSLINDVLEAEQLQSIQSNASQLLHHDSGRVDDDMDSFDAADAHALETGEERAFDLCRNCYQQFCRNPLGHPNQFSMNFSSN